MKIQVGDIVKILGNQFLYTVLDMNECEIQEFNQVLVQRVGDIKDRWVYVKDCATVPATLAECITDVESTIERPRMA